MGGNPPPQLHHHMNWKSTLESHVILMTNEWLTAQITKGHLSSHYHHSFLPPFSFKPILPTLQPTLHNNQSNRTNGKSNHLPLGARERFEQLDSGMQADDCGRRRLATHGYATHSPTSYSHSHKLQLTPSPHPSPFPCVPPRAVLPHRTDVMDGHFVPNITMGAPILSCVKKGVPEIFMDCHMMVEDPIKVRKMLFSRGGVGR
jgi:hypothetical protein